jgi:hypothetical protein
MPLTAADCLASTVTEWGSSRWAAHNRCGAEYDLRYNKRIYRLPMARDASPVVKPIPFHVGTIVHAGIRLVETGTMAPQEAIAAVADAAAAQGSRFTGYDVAEGQRLLEAYWAHWGEENAGWPEGITIVGTEIQLKAAGLRHTGAIDTLIDDGSQLIIVDTKTRASKLPEDAERVFATNPQFLSLSYMLQESRDLENPPPVMVNAVVKTKVPDFHRVLVRFRQSQVDAWARNQQQIENNSSALQESGNGGCEAVMNYSACAPAIGSKCDYFYYCHAESEEERDLKYGTGIISEESEAA